LLNYLVTKKRIDAMMLTSAGDNSNDKDRQQGGNRFVRHDSEVTPCPILWREIGEVTTDDASCVLISSL